MNAAHRAPETPWAVYLPVARIASAQVRPEDADDLVHLDRCSLRTDTPERDASELSPGPEQGIDTPSFMCR
jgi:hypothetical protein